jgi:hypothetical protein
MAPRLAERDDDLLAKRRCETEGRASRELDVMDDDLFQLTCRNFATTGTVQNSDPVGIVHEPILLLVDHQ